MIAIVDIEEMDAALRHFESLLIQDYQGVVDVEEETESEETETDS